MSEERGMSGDESGNWEVRNFCDGVKFMVMREGTGKERGRSLEAKKPNY